MTGAEFEVIFHEHKDAVYRFAWRMTGLPSAAEDITQDVFLSLLHQPNRFDPARGELRSFLLGVARNLALKRWRGENRWEEIEEDQFAAEAMDTGQGEVAEMVGKAVGALPPLQREVLILAEYEDLALEEIARVVHSEIGTVKSRLHRARENLRRMLSPLKPGYTEKVKTHGTIG